MNHTYHQTPTQTSKPLHISPAQLSAIAHQEAMRILTKTERLVYEYLRGWLESQRRSGDTRGVYPSRKYIAAEVRCHVSTVQRTFAKCRAFGLLRVIARHTTHKVWKRLHKQMTNLIELPSRDSVEKFISELVSLGKRKKRSPNRSKRKVEGSIAGRRSLLKAQAAALVAAESG